MLEVDDRTPGAPDAQVEELLAKLSSNMDVWSSIRSTYRIDVFFGLFMNEGNEGFCLTPATLLALGSRGIRADFDIYGPSAEETRDQSL